MRTKHCNLAAAMVLVWASGVARADWTLISGDFSEQKGLTVNTWDVNEGLSVTGESGKLAKVETRNVLSLVSDRAKATDGGGAGWQLSLRNGDVLYGEPVRMTGQSLEFTVVELGKILIPLKVIAGMSDVHATAPADAGTNDKMEKDTVRTKNGDVVDGLILNVDGGKVQISRSGGENAPAEIDMSLVARLTFGGTTPPRTVPALAVRVSFASGSVLTVPLDAKQKSFSWTINTVSLKDPAGHDCTTMATMIASIDVVGGRVVCLTELDATKDEQSTFMGTHWPMKVNKNVLVEPLKVGKKIYSRGLGVHTKSDLTYELDGSFETLKLRVGMDDSAAPQGSANVSVVLDGKVLWEKNALKAGEISEELALPVKGGKQLELRADPALGDGKLDVLGRVDWLNVALIRK